MACLLHPNLQAASSSIQVFRLPLQPAGANTTASLGLAQGLPSIHVLQRGFWGLEKGFKEKEAMASSSSDPKRRNKKHSWADMVVEGPKKAFPEPDKKAKEEVDEVEEEQWWHKDWKEGGKSWDECWQDREQEWQEWGRRRRRKRSLFSKAPQPGGRTEMAPQRKGAGGNGWREKQGKRPG